MRYFAQNSEHEASFNGGPLAYSPAKVNCLILWKGFTFQWAWASFRKTLSFNLCDCADEHFCRLCFLVLHVGPSLNNWTVCFNCLCYSQAKQVLGNLRSAIPSRLSECNSIFESCLWVYSFCIELRWRRRSVSEKVLEKKWFLSCDHVLVFLLFLDCSLFWTSHSPSGECVHVFSQCNVVVLHFERRMGKMNC